MNIQIVISLAMIIGIVLIVAAGVFLGRQFQKDTNRKDIDTMDGIDFEHYCAGLLSANGFVDVKVTRGSRDYGVDIFAKKDGITYAIQCKRYSGLVGIKAIQEVYAGKDYYDTMVGAVLTNQYFTKPAIQVAQKLKILLWDREYLQALERD